MFKYLLNISFLLITSSGLAQTKFYGTLKAHDGNDLEAGRVVVSQLNSGFDETMSTIDEYGLFEIQPNFPGPYLLKLYGVHHKPYYLPVFSDRPELELNIRLGTFDYLAMSEVNAIGSFNNFAIMDKSQWLTLTKEADEFKATVPGSGRTEHQLVRVIHGGAISGFGSAYEISEANYVTDGYVAVNDSAHITFNPKWLPPAGIETEVLSSEAGLSAIAEAYAHILTLQRVMRTRDFTEAIAEVEKRLAEAKSETEYAAFLMNYLAIDAVKKQVFFKTPQPDYFKGELNPEIIRDILDKIDPASNLWLMRFNAPGALPSAMTSVGPEGLVSDANAKIRDYLEKMVEKNPDQQVRAFALLGLARWAKLMGDEVALNDYYAQLSSFYKGAFAFADAQREFEMTKQLNKNDSIPDFEFVSLTEGSGPYNKASLKAKLTLIDFWATSCGPCIQQMPDLEKLYGEYKSKGFDIISVSMDKDPQRAQRFAKANFDFPWRHAYIPFAFKSQLAIDLEIYGLPRLIFVDQEGIVRRTVDGATSYLFLEKIIKEELNR